MGAAQSSARPSSGLALDDGDQELFSEFIDHSRATVDECAAIFRGTDAVLDDEEDGVGVLAVESRAQEKNQETGVDNDIRQHQNRLRRRLGGRRAASYPRRLPLTQFDEVFGMLVADSEPHFGFFQISSAPPVVIAHQVFCCVALLMRADLRAKIDFVLRLYADLAGRLTLDAKRLLISDMMAGVARLTGVADPIPSEILVHLEVQLIDVLLMRVAMDLFMMSWWCGDLRAGG